MATALLIAASLRAPWQRITARLRLSAHRPPLWLATATVAAGWVAAFALIGGVALFIQSPIHKDFLIFYVAAEAGLKYGWPAI